jgi:large subunit ribosomal protein L3
MVSGLLGRKIGMTQIFDAAGAVLPVTVIQAGPCVVVQKKVAAHDGYNALQLGFGTRKARRASKAEQGHLRKAGKGAFRVLREVRVADAPPYEVGDEIKAADVFKVGDRIDVTGTSKGRGFAGVIKRWSFAGFPASRGTHEYFRHGGSIGNRSFPGRVFKGKRMAGHYGNERVTTLNLEVVAIRPEQHLLFVKGAVPGARGGLVLVRRSVKQRGG